MENTSSSMPITATMRDAIPVYLSVTSAVRPVLPDLQATLSQEMVTRDIHWSSGYSCRFACWEWR